MARKKKTGKNSKKYIVEKEYYEDVTFTDPTTGELRIQKNVKITRYKLRYEIDVYANPKSDNFMSRLGKEKEEVED